MVIINMIISFIVMNYYGSFENNYLSINKPVAAILSRGRITQSVI